MHGAGSNFYAAANGDETVYTLAEPTEGEYTTYTVTTTEFVGYKAWPVKVAASEVEAAAAAIDFVEDDSVTEETGRLKTVSVDADGNVTTSAMSEAVGTAVSYTGTPEVSETRRSTAITSISIWPIAIPTGVPTSSRLNIRSSAM